MDVAAIAQLGESQTEDLEVPGSIPGLGIFAPLSWLTCTQPKQREVGGWVVEAEKVPRPGIEPGSSA